MKSPGKDDLRSNRKAAVLSNLEKAAAFVWVDRESGSDFLQKHVIRGLQLVIVVHIGRVDRRVVAVVHLHNHIRRYAFPVDRAPLGREVVSCMPAPSDGNSYWVCTMPFPNVFVPTIFATP